MTILADRRYPKPGEMETVIARVGPRQPFNITNEHLKKSEFLICVPPVRVTPGAPHFAKMFCPPSPQTGSSFEFVEILS